MPKSVHTSANNMLLSSHTTPRDRVGLSRSLYFSLSLYFFLMSGLHYGTVMSYAPHPRESPHPRLMLWHHLSSPRPKTRHTYYFIFIIFFKAEQICIYFRDGLKMCIRTNDTAPCPQGLLQWNLLFKQCSLKEDVGVVLWLRSRKKKGILEISVVQRLSVLHLLLFEEDTAG